MTRGPLLDAWFAARQKNRRPLQIPGHKNRYAHGEDALGADLLGPLLRDDVPLQGGVDDNAYGHRYLEQAEALWSSAVGADYARFLVGGSSQGNIAALSAVSQPGRPVAIDRTSHRSAQAALVISGARPVWVYPELHPETGFPLGVPARALAGVRAEVTALFVTSPSYGGTLSDVSALASAAHARGIPLVVDQAWGAHLGFMAGRGAIACGADLAVTSVHKALLGYTQTAVVTMRGDRVNRDHLDRCVDLVATTSPSGTLLASIDATRVVLERDHGVAIARTVENVKRMRETLRRVKGLVVLDETMAPAGMDPFKLTLWLPRTGADGVAIGKRLWEMGLNLESADRDTLVCSVTLVDEAAFCDETAGMLASLIEAGRGRPRPAATSTVWCVEPDVACTPREAFFARRRRIPLEQAVGEVSAEQFCPYPPGVPIIAPGERITRDALEILRKSVGQVRIAYCSDPSLATVEVVDALQ